MNSIRLSSGKIQIIFLILLSGIISIYVQWPILSNYYNFDGDTSNIIFWFNSIELDQIRLNSNDLMSQYAGWFIVPGLKIIYLLGSFITEPIILAKIIPIITSTTCVLLIYLIGNFINGSKCGLIAAISFICFAWFYRYRQMFGSADAEEFSLVLMLLFLYFIIKQNYGKLIWIILLEAIFYPPLLIITLITIGLFFIYKRISEGVIFLKKNKYVIRCLMITATVSICFLFFKYQQSIPEFLGRSLLPSEVMAIGDFRPGARNAIFSDPDTLVSRAISDTTGFGLDLPKKLILGFGCLLFFFPFKLMEKKNIFIKIPAPLWIFLFSGVVMCIVANLVLFKLYEPSRFIQNPSTIFIILFAANYIVCLMEWIETKRIKIISNLIPFAYILTLLIIILPQFGCHKESAQEYIPVIDYLSKEPKTSFIAGNPKLMNSIGIYSKRRVFLTYKLSTEILWINYYNEMTRRTNEYFDAYYSDNLTDILEFTKEYGITHFVIDLNHFSEQYLNSGEFYFKPFNEHVKNITSSRKTFFLMNAPEASIIFKNRDIIIVDCRKLENLLS